VIWHDNYVVFGDESRPMSRRIAELTSQEFKQLAPIHASSAGEVDDEDLMGTSPASTASAASWDSWDSAASGASPRLLRKHRNDTPALPHEPTLRAWRCDQEDGFPTLAEVFAALPPWVAFDLEIKMATPDDMAVTPPAEVDRMVTATLAAVDKGLKQYGQRAIMFTSFDPDICLEVKRRWATGCFVKESW
jgi:glycerophosphodiester phosphodiesterase